MTGLTTHVLDTASGFPAKGLLIELFSLDGPSRHFVKAVTTNDDGRVDNAILSGDDFKTGVYELVFHAGDYFKKTGAVLSNPPFLDIIPLRFGISNPLTRYHVPLLVSPYSYSTYRGS